MPTTTYGPTTTAAEIVANVGLHGRRAVVTGASSGIGVEAARALASTGAEVTLAVRNVEAGRKVADGIADKLPPDAPPVQVSQLDLADPVSVAGLVRACSGPLRSSELRLGSVGHRSGQGCVGGAGQPHVAAP